MINADSYRRYQSLILNDIEYSGKDASLVLATQLLCDEEEEMRHIGQFVADWLNDETTIELQTSGSTGTPKKIQVKKAAMVASVKRTIDFFQLQPGNSALLCLSAKYIAGKMMLVRAMVGQLKLYTASVNSNPLQSLHYKIDFAAMVPLQVSRLINENKEILNNIRHLIIGGGSVNSALSQALHNLKTNSWETYGMTETVSHIALRNIKSEKAVFKLLPGLSVSVDERNCLVINSSDINESRLVTNDIVEFSSDDEFVLLGRFDNVINTGGVKVVAEELERKLLSSLSIPFVISWKKDDFLGQKIVLVCESSKPIMINELDFSSLTRYEIPKEVICIDEIPKTETGKVQRKKLQQLIDK
jgi:O-succinylbenzoic acid--CoA ligase